MTVRAFNVPLPADGTVVTLEDEATEGPTEGTDVQSSEGGTVLLRNSGTVNALVGGNDKNCVYPLNNGDQPLSPILLGPNDKLTAKVAAPGTAGQVSVVQITK